MRRVASGGGWFVGSTQILGQGDEGFDDDGNGWDADP